MKSSLPIFAAWLLLACSCGEVAGQLPASAAPGAPAVQAGSTPSATAQQAPDAPDAEQLLRRALATVDAHASVATRIRFMVNLLGESKQGTGIYRQQGRGEERRLRFELRIESTDQAASHTRQVCDGQQLWILDDVAGQRGLAKIDLGRVRAARPKTAGNPASNAWLAIGGLPKLLANLDASFRFSSVSQNRLDDLPVWTLEGTWEPAQLIKLLPEEREAIEAGRPANTSKLAKNLPDRAIVHFGGDDLFPYQFEYWRSQPVDKSSSATEAAAHSADKSQSTDKSLPPDRGTLLFVMEFYEVQLQAPIDPGEFAFDAGNLVPTDRTAAFLEKLGLEESLPAGAKPAAAPRR